MTDDQHPGDRLAAAVRDLGAELLKPFEAIGSWILEHWPKR